MDQIKINRADNVAVAMRELPVGSVIAIEGSTLTLRQTIPAGHKFALCSIATNGNVVKYGYPIGHATEPIAEGDWVNEHNLKSNLDGLLEYRFTPIENTTAPIAPSVSTFSSIGTPLYGYRRADGSVGFRNEIWIIPTVGCVNGICTRLAEQLRNETAGRGVDAIVAFPHNYGCSQLGDDHLNTRTILQNIALHPNAGGVLVVGLGCENNQLAAFRERLDARGLSSIRYLEAQKVEDEIGEGMTLLRELYGEACRCEREEVPFSSLKVGLKCGGSDGFSGITANPLLGQFSDLLVAAGGTVVLTEVPEMFGAETILMNRCATEGEFEKMVDMINVFKQYFIRNDQPIYENPSPGNRAGGISTLEEKSLGCTQKSGSSAVCDVLRYGDLLCMAGLNLLTAPGNDLVASTALGAAGCQLVLFTTGRGTPFGSFVPTLKVSTNTRLSCDKPKWIDFNAGTLVEGETMVCCLRRFVETIVAVANGMQTNNEVSNYREIAIFKTGVTL